MVVESHALLRAMAGVRLELVERRAKKHRRVSFLLSTRRLQGTRVIADEAEAHRAFAREVAVCLKG